MSGYTKDILSKYDNDDLYNFCWCDKIGGKVWWYSDKGCEDFYIINKGYYPKDKIKKNKIRLNHYKRKLIDKEKLIKLSKKTFLHVYFDEKLNRYIRCYYSGRKGYAKYCSNRKIRNSNKFSYKKSNNYRKVYDFWWEVF